MKNKGGRPTKMTPECVNKLEDAFTWGCTDEEACCYADISRTTLFNYCETHPEFLNRKEDLKSSLSMRAKRIQSAEIDSQSIVQANKVLDRETGKKIQITGANGGAIEWDLMLHEANPQSS